MQPGSEIGAYRVLSRIGAGGMGAVWLAEHTTLGRRAAIKVLHSEYSNRAEIVARFFNEARAATAISDPGIVQIFDFGQHADGSAFIVMELLEGEPLDKRLARLGALAVLDALRVMRQVATSLGAAHARGIVHRDLKPENIFLVRDAEVAGGERPKILDFGIAKLSGANTNVKTQTAAMMGTPAYMSPEQCRGAGQVDQRSDVYSLGCVLFTLVTGRAPFDADGVGEIIAMHLREAAPLASSVAPGIPSAVDELIARCLTKDPDERFASATELAQAIARVHPSGAGSHVALPVTVAMGAHAMPTTLSSVAVSRQIDVARPWRRRGWTLGGLVLAVVGGAVGFAVVASSSGERRAATRGSAELPLPPSPPRPATKVDERAVTTERIRNALEHFTPTDCSSETAIEDGWGKRMRYACSDRRVVVMSAGPDGEFENADDVTGEKAMPAPVVAEPVDAPPPPPPPPPKTTKSSTVPIQSTTRPPPDAGNDIPITR